MTNKIQVYGSANYCPEFESDTWNILWPVKRYGNCGKTGGQMDNS